MSRWMPCWWAKKTLSSASAVDVRLRLGRRAVAHARRADPGSFRLRQYAKGSPWIIRLIGLLLGAVFAEWAAGVEGAGWLPDTWQYSATTASSVLSSVVGSMAALLGFVVTIGVLVVQQATGTLSRACACGTATGCRRPCWPHLSGVAVSVSLMLLLIYLNRVHPRWAGPRNEPSR
ncbi:hypothetical protein [Streptomyces sp. NBC_00272]|uniref:hypothetical protein n=1 Tax=Streptomyces sp. NBC_00272 TaxID=2975698 RepID=UPI002E2CA8D6|nr:hypothetical protein [Streptomyces sp. NBC_00272]